jgi:FSR family fosmidomycin resistance protein-like MFS transporter
VVNLKILSPELSISNMKADTINNNRFHFRTLFVGVIPLFVLAHFGHHVLTALTVPLLPFVRNDFTLDYTRSGMVISAFSLAYGIGQLPAGWLADRVGARLVITIGISGVALAGLFVGLSQTYIMLIAFLALMGLAGGGYHPAAAPLISMSVEHKNLGRALGVHIIGGSASFFLAPLIGVAIASAWGWRGTYIGLAVPTFLFGILFYFVVSRLQDRKEQKPISVKRRSEKSTSQLRRRQLAAFIILSTFSGAIITSIIAFIPLFMVDHFAVSNKTAGFFLALIYSAGLWAAPLGGYLSDHIGRVRMILALSLLLGPVIYMLNLVPYGIGFGALLLVFGMILMMRMPIAEAYIVSQSPEHLRSTILGIYFFSVIEGGGVLTPVIGYIIDQFGFYASFTISGGTVVIATLICSLFLIKSRG